MQQLGDDEILIIPIRVDVFILCIFYVLNVIIMVGKIGLFLEFFALCISIVDQI